MENHLKGFLKDMEIRNYSPFSVLKYARCIRIFFSHLKQNRITDLRKVGREELKGYNEALGANPYYSPSYKGSNIRAVKLFFKYLKKTNVVLYDFSVILKEPRMPKQLPKEPLTASEVKAMLDAPDLRTKLGVRDRAILETFYSSGIRVQEMSRLSLLDLDLEKGFLFIREGKGKKDRVVPLGQHACLFMKTYLEAVRPIYLGKVKEPEAGSGELDRTVKTNRLWVNKYGRPLVKGDIVVLVRKYREQAGITKQVTAHSFRRTLAVELIRNECDFLSVKEILGHSLSRTTLRYCALSGVELKEAMEKCHPRYDLEEPEDVIPQIKSMG